MYTRDKRRELETVYLKASQKLIVLGGFPIRKGLFSMGGLDDSMVWGSIATIRLFLFFKVKLLMKFYFCLKRLVK